MPEHPDELYDEWYAQGGPKNEPREPVLHEDEEYCEYEAMYGEHDWDEPKSVDKIEIDGEEVELYARKCRVCGLTEEEPLIEEHWEDRYIEILGKKYRALKSWGNISRCAECGKVIMDIPLILWYENDDGETDAAVTFHFECAEKAGILELLGIYR